MGQRSGEFLLLKNRFGKTGLYILLIKDELYLLRTARESLMEVAFSEPSPRCGQALFMSSGCSSAASLACVRLMNKLGNVVSNNPPEGEPIKR
ncbi:hypothetical protein P7K49_012262 [Saguinus oedipus]|uniref:Uncharacterized protein n=1 Tax=Saguinus oedipus TaxID=9490 RepID=A0ABQ9VTP9_SAGOE|nr:hypothetical protein P7K49_012262 [Saguinus oedipus]